MKWVAVSRRQRTRDGSCVRRWPISSSSSASRSHRGRPTDSSWRNCSSNWAQRSMRFMRWTTDWRICSKQRSELFHKQRFTIFCSLMNDRHMFHSHSFHLSAATAKNIIGGCQPVRGRGVRNVGRVGEEYVVANLFYSRSFRELLSLQVSLFYVNPRILSNHWVSVWYVICVAFWFPCHVGEKTRLSPGWSGQLTNAVLFEFCVRMRDGILFGWLLWRVIGKRQSMVTLS